jgi:hypothetical protein
LQAEFHADLTALKTCLSAGRARPTLSRTASITTPRMQRLWVLHNHLQPAVAASVQEDHS